MSEILQNLINNFIHYEIVDLSIQLFTVSNAVKVNYGEESKSNKRFYEKNKAELSTQAISRRQKKQPKPRYQPKQQ